jgi:hypothetical protein
MSEMLRFPSYGRDRIPRRWEQLPGFAALLGLLALSGDVRADANDARSAVSQAPNATKPAPAESTVALAVQQVNAIIAPLLDEALRYDGRGAFGCVVVNPPTFLAEDEAIELIRKELETAGLSLQECVDLDNVEAPTGGSAIHFRSSDDVPPKLSPQVYMFDLADTDRAVFIEYLSARDHKSWVGMDGCSAYYYDFPSLAKKVSDSFQKRQSDKRTAFGIFFDPLARVEISRPDVSGLNPAQQRLAYVEFLKAMRQERNRLDAKAKEKLRRQVRHFVEFLRQEGVVGKGE